MKSALPRWLPFLLRVLLGALLLWAAVSKLANPREFLESLDDYKLPLSHSLLQYAAIALPWVEFLCGLLLVANVWTKPALALSAALFFAFALATGQAWVRGVDLACGCLRLKPFALPDPAGTSVEFYESAPFACVRALVLAVLALMLLRRQLNEVRTSSPPGSGGG